MDSIATNRKCHAVLVTSDVVVALIDYVPATFEIVFDRLVDRENLVCRRHGNSPFTVN
jgi:hypothetical protein